MATDEAGRDCGRNTFSKQMMWRQGFKCVRGLPPVIRTALADWKRYGATLLPGQSKQITSHEGARIASPYSQRSRKRASEGVCVPMLDNPLQPWHQMLHVERVIFEQQHHAIVDGL